MSSSLPYPRIVTADLHAHERHGRQRMREIGVLVDKLSVIRDEYHVKTLIIDGDLCDRNTPLAVDSIVLLAQFFHTFEKTVIVVGNHDTPVRAAARTMLDIYRLVGAIVVSQTTIIGNDLFVPYYDVVTTHPSGGIFDQIHMHKDFVELNYYVDAEFGTTLKQIPPCRMCFNGHLHRMELYTLPNTGVYAQLGAPFPTTWNDVAELNNGVWLLNSPTDYKVIEMNITGDDKGVDDPKFAFLRTKKEEKSGAADQNPLEGISVLRDSTLSIEDVLRMTNFNKIVNRIISRMVACEVSKVDAVRI